MPVSIRPTRRFPVQCFVTYHVGLWLLITVLLLSGGPAAYAEWVKIGTTDDGMTIYVDPDTIRQKGDLVKMWYLYDYESTQTVADSSYLSTKAQDEFDCAGELHRTLAFTFFSGKMGSGKADYSNSEEHKWEPVAPRSVDQAVWKIACDKK
jgi:hypothetical protein